MSADANALGTHQAHLMTKGGETAEQQGNVNEAIRLYEQARALDPQQSHVCRRLAVLYDQQGADPQAHAAYEQAVARSPEDPDVLNDLGVYHLRRSRCADAESWFRRALAVEPTHARAMNNLAISLAMQGQLEEGFEVFSRIAGPAAAYCNLGTVLMRQGRMQEARRHYQLALECDHTLRPATELLAELDRLPASEVNSPHPGDVRAASHSVETR